MEVKLLIVILPPDDDGSLDTAGGGKRRCTQIVLNVDNEIETLHEIQLFRPLIMYHSNI